MAAAFDPYHTWLGISPKDQPPDHYRLLGIAVGDSDPEAIEHAAEMRIAHLKSLRAGDHAALAKTLCDELSEANISLLAARAGSDERPSADEEEFDGYHTWLGIRSGEGPVDHYRLLGIDRFEFDVEVIENAADMRVAYVRRFQTGRLARHVQKIRDQIAAAGVCLRNAERRSKYDAQLRGQPVGPPTAFDDAAAADFAEPVTKIEARATEAVAFDPYHLWLHIPPEEQPPDHYRLLGINLFEPNLNVIKNAADARIANVRQFQTGQHTQDARKICTEIAEASACLLSRERKSDYDAMMRGGRVDLRWGYHGAAGADTAGLDQAGSSAKASIPFGLPLRERLRV